MQLPAVAVPPAAGAVYVPWVQVWSIAVYQGAFPHLCHFIGLRVLYSFICTFTCQTGNLVFISGQIPMKAGELTHKVPVTQNREI